MQVRRLGVIEVCMGIARVIAAQRRERHTLTGRAEIVRRKRRRRQHESRRPGWRETTKRWCRDNSRYLILRRPDVRRGRVST
jgi:hypothetical protein